MRFDAAAKSSSNKSVSIRVIRDLLLHPNHPSRRAVEIGELLLLLLSIVAVVNQSIGAFNLVQARAQFSFQSISIHFWREWNINNGRVRFISRFVL